jgi:Ca2+/H+ antiporter
LIGLTLVLGGALASSLRGFGVLFPGRPYADVTGAMMSGISVGLGLSVITGALLVAPRLSDAAANGTFRIKMLVLVAAATFHVTTYRRIGETEDPAPGHGPWPGAVGLSLWLAVALAGCAYILLE